MKELAITAAKEAGEILLDGFGKIKRIDTKGLRDLVSNVDIASEKKIIETIKNQYPDHNILCEESDGHVTNSDYKWIIDPLDGTHNYIYGISTYGISIALEYKEELVLGVIYFPYSNEMFWAERGKGAYLNNERLRVSDRKLDEAMIVFDSTLHTDRTYRIKFLDVLVDKAFGLRISGSAARNLTYVALGCADLVVEYGDRPWDFAAGGLIIEEAGGMLTTLDGEKWSPYIQGYLASNGKFHDEVLKLIKPFRG